MNWRARPLIGYQVIIDLIASTTTEARLKVLCKLDPNTYPKGVVVSDKQMVDLNIERDVFHGEWDYSPRPRSQIYGVVIP